MKLRDDQIMKLVLGVMGKFRTFGGGQKSEYNPLVNALSDKTLTFAFGVDVEDVVRFVVENIP